MLSKLEIQQFAIVSHMSLDFQEGLTVITGETGAGKSLICDAIQILMGQDSNPEIDIQYGKDTAHIVGTFTIQDPPSFLIPFVQDNQLVIQRTLHRHSRSQSLINQKVVSKTVLKELAPFLCHISSQHDSQKLFNESEALHYLDQHLLQSDPKILSEYQIAWSSFESIRSQKQLIESQIKEAQNQAEFWQYQIEDIDRHQLNTEEEDSLNASRNTFKHFGKIQACFQDLQSATQSMHSLWDQIHGSLQVIATHHPNYQKLLESSHHYASVQEEWERDLRSMAPQDSIEEIDIDTIEGRLDLLFKLKQKYKVNSIAELVDTANTLREKLSAQSDLESKQIQITAQYEEQLIRVQKLAESLHEKRQKSAPVLEQIILNILQDLSMTHAQFKIQITTHAHPNENGIDQVQFLFSANPGIPVAPLERVASGGEISRIFLALQCAQTQSKAQSIIFDEIDTGIGGITATKVAQKLLNLSQNTQLICISHLVQIAKVANQLIIIDKTHLDNSTQVQARLVQSFEKPAELEKMQGISNQTGS